ncbi:MAG: hypothetical protein NT144_13575 [Bacteroidia bacterium]|nr:hypothetical protein [Bacteroidia bacterium]
MKLIAFLIFAGTLAASATSYSQSAKIDIEFCDSTLSSYLAEIEKKTEFIFIYDAGNRNLDSRKKCPVFEIYLYPCKW